MPATASASLRKLLLRLFEGEQLRRFVRDGVDGEALCDALPGRIASDEDVADAIVGELIKRNLANVEFFGRLVGERPADADAIVGVARAFIGAAADGLVPAPPPPARAASRRKWAWALIPVGLIAVGVGIAVVVARREAPAPSCQPATPRPRPGPDEALPLTVLLFDDGAIPDGTIPTRGASADARRAFSASLLARIEAQKPRAILMDTYYARIEDDPSRQPGTLALGQSFAALHDRCIPAFILQRPGVESAYGVCGPHGSPASAGCVSGMLSSTAQRLPSEKDVSTSEGGRWSTCDAAGRPTLPGLAAHELRSGPHLAADGLSCEPAVFDIRLPPDDPCARPYEILYVSEFLSGRRAEVRDPLLGTIRPACRAEAPSLTDRVVIIGDSRPSAGQPGDARLLAEEATGRSLFLSGPEVHAVIAWNALGRLYEKEPR